MMDRRVLLKRLGMAGLAIPVAAVVEKNLVLALGYLPEVGNVKYTVDNEMPMLMTVDGYANAFDIELQRFTTDTRMMGDGIKRLAHPSGAILKLEMLVHDGTITAPMLEPGSRIRVQIAMWPPAYTRYKSVSAK